LKILKFLSIILLFEVKSLSTPLTTDKPTPLPMKFTRTPAETTETKTSGSPRSNNFIDPNNSNHNSNHNYNHNHNNNNLESRFIDTTFNQNELRDPSFSIPMNIAQLPLPPPPNPNPNPNPNIDSLSNSVHNAEQNRVQMLLTHISSLRSILSNHLEEKKEWEYKYTSQQQQLREVRSALHARSARF